MKDRDRKALLLARRELNFLAAVKHGIADKPWDRVPDEMIRQSQPYRRHYQTLAERNV